MKAFLFGLLGVLVACVLLLIIIRVAWWLFKRKLRSAFGELGSDLGTLMGAANALGSNEMMPYRLEPTPVPEGNTGFHPEELQATLTALHDQGFEGEGLFYSTPNNQNLVSRIMLRSTDRLMVLVYDGPETGVRVEFAALYEDGTSRFVTNAVSLGFQKPPPQHHDRRPEATINELLEIAESLPNEGRREIDDGSKEVCAAYRQEALWRINQGGFSEDDARTAIQLASPDAEGTGEPMAHMILAMLNGPLEEGLMEELRPALLDHTGMSAREWEAVEDDTEIIHPMSSAEDLAGYLLRGQDDDDDDDAYELLEEELDRQLKTKPPLEVFKAHLADHPRKDEYRLLAEVHEPVNAHLYQVPSWPDDE